MNKEDIVNGIQQINGETYINGKKIDIPKSSNQSIVQTNGKTYINGYEFKKGKWVKTIKAFIICYILP